VHWTEIEVASEASGRPVFVLTGSTAAVMVARGITAVHLSMSHDAQLATAYVVAESVEAGSSRAELPVDPETRPPVAISSGDSATDAREVSS